MSSPWRCPQCGFEAYSQMMVRQHQADHRNLSDPPVSVCLNDHERRLTALEQQSRGYQEDGALAAGRGAGDGPGTIIARQRGLWDAIDRFQAEVSAATGWSIVSAKAYEGEFIRFVDKAIAERDTARAALRKYGSHDGTCESWEHAITHGRAACTCGPSDALAGGEANEGSGA